jgi:uncharacterized protein
MSSESETGELSGEAGARRQASAAAAVIADPAALGLAGFTATTMVLSCFNAGFLPSSGEKVVLPLALFYGGLAQLLAGMWEFRKGNTFGATAFSSYAAFWISFAAYVQFVVPALGGTSAAAPYTGLYLLAWTIFTAYMAIASLRTNVAIAAVLVLLFVTFLLLTLGEFGISALATVGGYLGLATALAAWYASAAVVTNETWGRVVLPVGARS